MVDAKKTLARLRGEGAKRKTMSLYLDESLYKEFSTACEDLTPARVMEQLMRDFLEDLKKKPKK